MSDTLEEMEKLEQLSGALVKEGVFDVEDMSPETLV